MRPCVKVDERPDYYALLGIPRTAAAGEVRAAYRRLALRHHPDRNPGDKEAERRFKEISEAYHVLSDEEKRRRYDQGGAFTGDGPLPGSLDDFLKAFAEVFDNRSPFGDFFAPKKPREGRTRSRGKCAACGGRGRVSERAGVFIVERTCSRCGGSAGS